MGCVCVEDEVGVGGCVWRGRLGGRGCVCGDFIEGMLGGMWVCVWYM